MDTNFYLDQFKKALDKLDKKLLHKKGMEAEAGVWLQSVVLRIQKNIGRMSLTKTANRFSHLFFHLDKRYF